MYMQVITFGLTRMDETTFRSLCDQLAPAWAAIPGLISKVWLSDAASGTHGGIYTWETQAAYEAYLESDYFHALATHPNFVNVESRGFSVLEAPTRVTRGLSAMGI